MVYGHEHRGVCKGRKGKKVNDADKLDSAISSFVLFFVFTDSPGLTTVTGTGNSVISCYSHKSKHPCDWK